MTGISINIETCERTWFFANPATKPLESLKSDKVSEIESKRDAATRADVIALGTMWQADERSQELLTAAIMIAQAGLPLPPVWRDSFNTDLPITSLTQLLSIAGAMAAQTQAAYTRSWQLKALVGSATTAGELDAIQW